MTLTRIDFKPKQERRVRFADSVGLELASIFLFDLINLANYHKKAIAYSKPAPPSSTNYSKSSSNISNSNSSSTATTNSTHSNLNNNNNNNNSYSSHYNNCNNYNIGSNYSHYSNQYSGARTNSAKSNASHTASSVAAINSRLAQQPAALHRPPPQRPPSSFSCQFIQPISLLSFKERVKINKIHLETCQINAPPALDASAPVSITFVVRVLNCSYNKAVTVRYTTDEWRTHQDLEAAYLAGSGDGWSDKFTATLRLTSQAKAFEVGQRIIFCLRYVFDGTSTHWDNNGGLNYSIKVS